jgi:hypothetical protein
MKTLARVPLLASFVGALLAISAFFMAIIAPAALAAPGFGLESFYASNCKVENCEKAANPAEELKKAEEDVYTQSAGHPPFGVTEFKVNRVEESPGLFVPAQSVKNLRIDVAPGVSTNPQAVAKCSVTNFESTEVEPVKHIFLKPECAESGPENTLIGVQKVETVLEVAPGVHADVPLEGKVYNLEQPKGDSSYFGVALVVGVSEAPLPPGIPLVVHTFIEGHVEWASDYHDYFEIKNITPGLLKSRLTFFGNIGTGGFLTNPSSCVGPGAATTTGWSGESDEGASFATHYTTPVGTENCGTVPFPPLFKLTPSTTQSDEPDGPTTELIVPHNPNPAELDSSQLKSASIVLPEGMTLSPSAAAKLQTCTPAQIGIHTRNEVNCPKGSKVASATLEVPGLPPGSLTGSLFLGGPEGGGPITGPPYTVYLLAESARYGISVRLQGEVVPNESTGRLTINFPNNPEQPFSNLILSFTTGSEAPLANPLACGTATTNTSLAPFTGLAPATPASSFTVDSNGSGGSCGSALPFALTQATSVVPSTGGSQSAFTLALTRGDGQQYLSQVSTTLPPGLVGLIPSVPLCPEPQAAQGACPAASQIGNALVLSGSGATPTQFSGPVYLTGPTGSAPYGMSVAVPVVSGPFNLGTVVVRPTINVNPFTAQITVSGSLPTIVKGVPVRLRNLTMAITRPGFLVNPTNCGVLATQSTLTSTLGATQSPLSTPFQVSGCSSLPFKPKFTASAGGKTSKANGASLTVKIGYPSGAQANIRSVVAQLPKQLPSRLTTLQKACTEAVFNANYWACPKSSRVGGATVTTPALPGKLTGPAFFVSHGGAAFPDLDLALSGDGVEVVLIGNTNIVKSVTTSTFASVPDVPVSSFELNLPVGSNSALAANGNLCAQTLLMPTTITAQSGATIKQNTKIAVSGCAVKIVKHSTKGTTAVITVQAPAAGRVSGTGSNLKTTYRFTTKPQKITLKVPLTSRGARTLSSTGRLKIKLRVGFIPKQKGPSSSARVTVTFR